MYAKLVEEGSLSGVVLPDGEYTRYECIQLTRAACELMSTNPSLPPEDAVGDVMQVYQYVLDELQKLKKPVTEE